MAFSSDLILHPPVPGMVKDNPDATYRFLLEIWNRTGGFTTAQTDLKGLKASVTELNTLQGIHTDNTVQQQLDSKVPAGLLGSMAYESKDNVDITGGVIRGTKYQNGEISASTVVSTNISASTFVNGVIRSSDIYLKTGSSLEADPIGTLYVNATTVVSMGNVEYMMMTKNILANTLNGNFDHLEVIGYGTFPANDNKQEIMLKVINNYVIKARSLSKNGGSWYIKAILQKEGANLKCTAEAMAGEQIVFPAFNKYSSFALDFASDFDVSFKALGDMNGDIMQEGMIIRFCK